MKPKKRNWIQLVGLTIMYYIGVMFLIKIPDFVKRQKKDIDKNLGEKRF